MSVFCVAVLPQNTLTPFSFLTNLYSKIKQNQIAFFYRKNYYYIIVIHFVIPLIPENKSPVLNSSLRTQNATCSNLELSGMIDAIPSLVFLIDCQTKLIVYHNREFKQFFQVSDSREVMEDEIAALVLPEDRFIYEEHCQKLSDTVDGPFVQTVFRMKNAPGDWRWMKLRSVIYKRGEDGKPQQTLHLAEDVTEHHQFLFEQMYWSTHDFLTGLVNRGYFEAQVNKISTGEHEPACILMIDIDGLKSVNDQLGHGQGDEVLRMARDAMQMVAREGDTVARLGGDEFAMLLVETSEIKAQSIKDQLQKIFDERSRAWETEKLGLSIGISSIRPGISLSEAIHKADQRMYRDKARRKRQKAR